MKKDEKGVVFGKITPSSVQILYSKENLELWEKPDKVITIAKDQNEKVASIKEGKEKDKCYTEWGSHSF